MELIKGKNLTSHEVLYTKFYIRVTIKSYCYARKMLSKIRIFFPLNVSLSEKKNRYRLIIGSISTALSGSVLWKSAGSFQEQRPEIEPIF